MLANTAHRSGFAGYRTSEAGSGAGFTLVELILFIGLLSVMSGAIVSFAVFSDTTRSRGEMTAEVNQNGAHVIDWVTQQIRNANDVFLPAIGESSDKLLLAKTGLIAEILIDPRNNRIRTVDRSGESFTLTTGGVGVEDLRFYHFGEVQDDGDIVGEGVSFFFRVYNHAVGTRVAERTYSKLFRTTVALPATVCTAENCSQVCCPDGACRAVCYECANDSDCISDPDPEDTFCCNGTCGETTCECDQLWADCTSPAGGVCCITDIGTGTFSCAVSSSCQCTTVADCSGLTPSCEESTCTYQIPACVDGACVLAAAGRCDGCSQCGDGWVDPTLGETCDDGDWNVYDPCPDGPGASCHEASCGDGFLCNDDSCTTGLAGAPEECDDGNITDGDGCSATCEGESLCEGGVPNGVEEGEEECDEGDLPPTPVCGDGSINVSGEECEVGIPCGTGTCNEGTCKCEEEETEEICNNGLDDDNDGTVDCDTDVCEGQPCGDGNTCSGGQCPDSCSPLLDQCNTCANSFKKWELSIPIDTVTNASCSFGECGHHNGVHILETFNFYGSSSHCNCAWCWLDTISDGGCEDIKPVWSMNYNHSDLRWELEAGAMPPPYVQYYVPIGEWNCTGPNTFRFRNANGICTGWPATITVTPVAGTECACGESGGCPPQL